MQATSLGQSLAMMCSNGVLVGAEKGVLDHLREMWASGVPWGNVMELENKEAHGSA